MSYTISTQYTAAKHGGTRAINKIKYLVYHYTGNGGTTATALANAKYFATTTRSASAHYVVDEKEVIYQCLNDNVIGWSVGDSGKGTMKGTVTNTNSISIEMVSHSSYKNPSAGKDQYYISESTINRAIELGVNLMKKYKIDINHVVRHYDVTKKYCPDPMCVTSKGEAAWANFKKKLNIAYNGGSINEDVTPPANNEVPVIPEEDDEVVEDRNVKIFGKDIVTKGIFKEDSNYLSPKMLTEAGLNVSSDGATPVVTMPGVKVKIDGTDSTLNGFNANGTNVVAIRELAEALGFVVEWKDDRVCINTTPDKATEEEPKIEE